MNEVIEQDLSPRSARFLKAAAERSKGSVSTEKEKNWTHAYFDLFADLPLRRRQILSMAWALEHEPVLLHEEELLFGQVYMAVPGSSSCDFGGVEKWKGHDVMTEFMAHVEREIPDMKALVSPQGWVGSWISDWCNWPGHVGWHWEWILKDGIDGMLRRIAQAEPAADEQGKENLNGMKIMLQAVLNWNDRHVEAMRQKLATASGETRKELQEKIAVGERVPRFGARNFREAVQSFHFTYLCTMFENPHGGNGPGRLDYHLGPYLERDLADGMTTPAQARELIDELFIRFHERWCFGWDGFVETIVVGGCDEQGDAYWSPLTEMAIHSIAALNLAHPSVYIRIPERTPEKLLHLAAWDLIHGGNRAQILNDREIIAAMTRDGHIPVEDARMYMCGGCMEISPQGMNGDMLFTGFVNTLKILEYVLTGGECLTTGERHMPHLNKSLPDYHDMEELYQAFLAELRRDLTLGFKAMDIASEAMAKFKPRFLLSSQIDDCIKRGRCMHEGGARYEDFGSTPLGLPNIADCLTAIRVAVFEEKFISGAELLAAMKNNFDGNEALRRHLLHLPKYGQGNAEADRMAARVIQDTCDIYDGYTNRLGGKIKPMIMTFMMAPLAGMGIGAMPDGRLKGTPITQGVTPQSVAMTDGILTAIRAAGSMPLRHFSGGASNIWDLDPSMAKPETVESLLKVFFQSGGQMFQGNIVDVAELRKAQEHPENYEHLLVRVGGYSGRFVALGKENQDEIINRRHHAS